MQVIEKAYAKVNISLNLTGQKDHNLHYLVSMICFCDYYFGFVDLGLVLHGMIPGSKLYCYC